LGAPPRSPPQQCLSISQPWNRLLSSRN
jgi:hypothetical protein